MKIKFLFFLLPLLLIDVTWLSSNEHPLILQSKFQTDTLFVQQASSANLKKDPRNPSQYILTLRDLYPRILYISNQSKHIVGAIPLTNFLKLWQEHLALFKDEGPSAVVSYLSFKPSSQSGVKTDVMMLSKPTYNRATNSISFIAKPEHQKPLQTGRFKNIVVVYDGLKINPKKINSQYKTYLNTELTAPHFEDPI